MYETNENSEVEHFVAVGEWGEAIEARLDTETGAKDNRAKVKNRLSRQTDKQMNKTEKKYEKPKEKKNEQKQSRMHRDCSVEETTQCMRLLFERS